MFVVEEARDIGGVGVPAWGGVILEDDCAARGPYPACRGSDRLTLVQAIPSYPGCQVEEDLGGGIVSFQTVDDGRDRDGARCCFKQNDFVRQVAMVDANVVRLVVAKSLGVDCKFVLLPIVPNSALPVAPPATYELSVAVLADVKTFYVEWGQQDRGALKMHVELNGDNRVEDKRLTILEGVADFQAAIGNEVEERGLLESSTGAEDAWWPNGPGEHGRPDRRTFPTNRAAMLGVSLMLASRGEQSAALARPWGPTRFFSRTRLRAATERVRLGAEP